MNRMHDIVHAAALDCPAADASAECLLRSPVVQSARASAYARVRHGASTLPSRFRIT